MTRLPPILVVSVVGALAFLCVKGVRFSAELYEVLPQDLPEVRGMKEVDHFFSRHGQLIVTLKGEEAWTVEEAGASLAAHLRAREDLVAAVYRELSVGQLVTEGGPLLAWTWLNAQPTALAALGERLATDRSQAQIAKSLATVENALSAEKALVASYDPLGFASFDSEAGASRADRMRSEDGTFEVLYIEGRGVDFSDYRAAHRWLADFRAVVADWKSEWGRGEALQIGMTGTPAFMAEVGTEMEKDMTVSVVATLVLISLLFFIMHRRLRPLSWLVAAMLAILAATLALGGVIYGDLSVMSVGFAAILMGLAVDYGIIIYREAAMSGAPARQLRKDVGPAILWAAATTALVFLSLNLSSLPGLAEMGNLVALGVAIGALVMLFFFAPVASEFHPEPAGIVPAGDAGAGWLCRVAFPLAVVVPLVAVASAIFGERPGLEANFHPFRIKESPAIVAWQQLDRELYGGNRAVPAVTTGPSLESLHQRLAATAQRIQSAENDGLVSRAVLAIDWIPNPGHQQRNAATIRGWLAERERLLGEIDAAGFSDEGAALTTAVFEAWRAYLDDLLAGGVVLPAPGLARWSVERIFQERDGRYAALGAVSPTEREARGRRWVEAVCDEHTAVASLQSLGVALNERIRGDLGRVFLPMMALLSIMLSVVFRHWKDVLLSLGCLLFAASVLVILTVWTPLSWNSFNVCGLPLLFGTGLDFSIHMIFALRRGDGCVATARQTIGRALFFCGASSAIGFGSLATASAHGLASLGIVCAVGILVNMTVATVLLPHWYRRLHRLPN